MGKSKIVVIEGTDGSGKATQAALLVGKICEKRDVYTTSFPRYNSRSSELVKMYLSGEISQNPNDVSAKAASMTYAMDRYITYKKELESIYDSGRYVIVLDRYVGSNIIHQGAKEIANLTNEEEKEKKLKSFISWLDNLEHNDLGIPRADVTIFLHVPVEFTKKLREGRNNKFTGKEKQDIHESDVTHLQNATMTGLLAAKMLGWHVIECVKDGNMRTVEDIEEEIYSIVEKTI